MAEENTRRTNEFRPIRVHRIRTKLSPILWSAGALPLVLAVTPPSVHAGDPIDFSRGNTAPHKSERGRLARELKPEGPDITDGLTEPEVTAPSASYSVRAVSTKEARRQKDAALEKKNWMILDKGQLQESREEEESYGLGSADGLEKEKTEADYWWGPRNGDDRKDQGLFRPGGSTRLPGQSRGATSRTTRSPSAEEADQRRLATDTAEAKSQIARQMDPKSIFSRSASSGAASSDGGAARPANEIFSRPAGLGGVGNFESSRQERSDFSGVGGASAHGAGLGLDSRLDSKAGLGGSLSTPFSPGLFSTGPRAAGGGFSSGSSFSSGFGDSKSTFGGGSGLGGGTAMGDPYGSRGDNSIFGNSPSTFQQPNNSLSRSLRDERPKMPGQ